MSIWRSTLAPLLASSMQVIFGVNFNSMYSYLIHITSNVTDRFIWTQQVSQNWFGMHFESGPDVATNSKHAIKSCVAWRLNRTAIADPANNNSGSLKCLIRPLIEDDEKLQLWYSEKWSGKMIDKQEETLFTDWLNDGGPDWLTNLPFHAHIIWTCKTFSDFNDGTFKTRKINRPPSFGQ